MKKRVYIMRHGKSDWSRSLVDEQRPLNKRGARAVRRMGRWMREQNFYPQCIYSSTARRAEQTALGLDFAQPDIRWEGRLYLAPLDELLSLLAGWLPDSDSLMLIGHNPGLEHLLSHLVPENRLAGHGKLFPTAALAVVELPAGGPAPGRAELVRLQRPRDLDD